MIDQFRFLEPSWWLVGALVGLLLWFLFIWKERTHFPQLRFYIHSCIALIGIVCLVLLAIGLEHKTESNANSLVLLTPGHTTAQLDSIKRVLPRADIQQYKPGRPLYAMDEPPKSVWIVGQGIPGFDWYQLDALPTRFVPAPSDTGVMALHYQRDGFLADSLKVKGRLRTASSRTQLRLLAPDHTAVDSVVISSTGMVDFELATPLKAVGNLSYHLQVNDGDGKESSLDPIPVRIRKAPSLSIAILNDFPLFETKYLKNYLAEKGHEVITRSRITKGRFKFEFFNTSKRGFSFTKETLNELDLLIVDASTLRNLGAQRRNLLQYAIENEGLGLLLLPENASFSGRVPLIPYRFQPKRMPDVILNHGPQQPLPVYAFQFRESVNLVEIHSSESGVITAYQLAVSGRIGTTLLQNTYELVLGGKRKEYYRLWSDIISSLSKREQKTRLLTDFTKLSYPEEPCLLQLQTPIKKPRLTDASGALLPLKQDYNNPQRWSTRWYPKSSGWHSFQLANDSTRLYHYVMKSTDWGTLRSERIRAANLRNTADNNQSQIAPLTVWTPVNKFWFFIPFLLCLGYLWLAAKL